MNKLSSIAIIFFVGIGCNTSLQPQLNIASEFRPYVTAYKQEAANQGKHITITSLIIAFKKLPEDTAGRCDTGAAPTIYINSVIWSTLQPLEREALIFHELGHCVQGRSHQNAYIVLDGDWVPVSLMNEVLIDAYTYGLYKQQYMYELFRLKWP